MYSFVLTFTHSNSISSGALLSVLSLVHSNTFVFGCAVPSAWFCLGQEQRDCLQFSFVWFS